MISRERVLNIIESKDALNSTHVKQAKKALHMTYFPQLTWYEKACLISRVHEYKCYAREKWTIQLTAEFLEISPGHVYLLLRLFRKCLELPGLYRIKNLQEVRELVSMPPKRARRLIREKLKDEDSDFEVVMGE